MDVFETEIPDVKRIVPKRLGDARGWFSETFRVDAMERAGITNTFIQDNQSFSAPQGTIRGLHFQIAPRAQAKLIRVLQAPSSTWRSTSAAARRPTGSTWP